MRCLATVQSMGAVDAEREITGYLKGEACFGAASDYKDRIGANPALRKVLTYGEVTYAGFTDTLQALPRILRTDASARFTFADLGSGSARGVMIAALSGIFSHCLGIELVPDLHNIAVRVLGKHVESLAARSSALLQVSPSADGDGGRDGDAVSAAAQKPWECEVELMCASITTAAAVAQWSECDVVFACSLEFGPTLQRELNLAARRMRAGAFLICMHELEGEDDAGFFTLVSRDFRTVSWSWALTFMYVRSGVVDEAWSLAAGILGGSDPDPCCNPSELD